MEMDIQLWSEGEGERKGGAGVRGRLEGGMLEGAGRGRNEHSSVSQFRTVTGHCPLSVTRSLEWEVT